MEKSFLTGTAFYGDFLSRSPLDELTEAPRGRTFRREDAAAVLQRYPLRDFLGGITKDEVLETMFRAYE